jgi:hypothetical protein
MNKNKLLIALSICLIALGLSGCGVGRGIVVDLPGLDFNIDVPEMDVKVEVPGIDTESFVPQMAFNCRMPGSSSGLDLRDTLEGSGDVVVESRSVPEFDRVALKGCGEVFLTQGDRGSISVEVDDNLLPYITTEVVQGELILSFTEEIKDRVIEPTAGIRFNVGFKELEAVNIYGAGVIKASSLDVDQFEVNLYGAGDITLRDVFAEKLEVLVPGAGKVEIHGRVQEQEVLLSGVGSYEGQNLESEIAKVALRGLGGARLWVTEFLNVEISGAGGVSYYGSPTVTQQITGLGSLNHLGER